jgi:hypothetical protein
MVQLVNGDRPSKLSRQAGRLTVAGNGIRRSAITSLDAGHFRSRCPGSASIAPEGMTGRDGVLCSIAATGHNSAVTVVRWLGIAAVLVACGTAPPPSQPATGGAPTPTPSGSATPAAKAPAVPIPGFPPIAIVSDIDGGARLYLAAADGDRQPLSPASDVSVYESSPAWSPDGRWLAFHRINESGIRELHVHEPATGVERAIAEVGPPSSTDPRVSWSPDGSRIAYWSTSGTDNEIMIIDIGGDAPMNLTRHDAADRYPAWSPDGASIAFWSDRSAAERSGWHPPTVATYGSSSRSGRCTAQWRGHPTRAESPSRSSSRANAGSSGSSIRTAPLMPSSARMAASSARHGLPTVSRSRTGRPSASSVSSGLRVRTAETLARSGPAPAAIEYRLVSHPDNQWPSPPSWSPDSKAFAVELAAGGRVEVLVVQRDGERWTSLTPPEASEGTPDWRPSPP